MRSLRALLPYYRPYLGRIAAGLLLVVVANVFTLATPAFLQRGVDALGRPGAAHTLVLMAAGLAFGLLDWVVWLMVVLTAFTVAQRIVHTLRELGTPARPETPRSDV